MLDEEMNASTRSELLRLAPSGDLLDLARQMRDMGVESLLFCRPSGRIEQVVTDRQIAHLAATPDPLRTAAVTSTDRDEVEPASEPASVDPEPAIPRQGVPARTEHGAAASRT